MDEEQIIKRIKDRTIFRQKIAIERDKFRSETYSTSYDRDDISLLIGESIDDYIEHRIQTDKVLEGILKDIQCNQVRMEKFAHELIDEQRLKSEST